MAAALQFRGGGSLDGAELELPAHVTGVVTIDRDGRSYYILDDQAGASGFAFVGFDTTGETMGKIARAFSAANRAEQEAIAAASAAQGCGRCGRTFGSPSAYAAAHDGRCLPDHMIESMLTEVSGVWCTRGSDTARR
jgi:hypothetical protein